MKKYILWIFALVVCCAPSALAQDVSSIINARGYQVGPGDVIEGKVLGEEEFNFTATVDEDGNFEVPFFDKPISALCKTERELRTEVTKLVAKYIRSPQVSVQVKERKSRPPATIYGEVRQQQQIILTRKARLLELLSFAGGVNDRTASGMIQIFRTQPPMCVEPEEIDDWKTSGENGLDVPSRMYSIASLRLGKEESNPVIYPGDIIIVPKAAPIYMIGEIRSVGEFALTEGGLPLTEAIARAGGISRQAKTKNITIRRLKPNSKDREIITVNYDAIKKGEQKDVMLEPYDIVEVDKAKKSIAQILLEIATGGVQNIANTIPVRVL